MSTIEQEQTWKNMVDLPDRAVHWQPIIAFQGNVKVAVMACFHCRYYVGKCRAETLPVEEVAVCKACREQYGYGDRPVLRIQFNQCVQCGSVYTLSHSDLENDDPAMHKYCTEDCWAKAEGLEEMAEMEDDKYRDELIKMEDATAKHWHVAWSENVLPNSKPAMWQRFNTYACCSHQLTYAYQNKNDDRSETLTDVNIVECTSDTCPTIDACGICG